MSNIKATIFDIQRNSFVDGPGIRTTVFFKDCNLRCKWCHNPESQSPKKEILSYDTKCTHCGKCKNLTIFDDAFFCPNHAKEICGKDYTVDELLSEILKDKLFYNTSGGGVTFSGGECMLYPDFLCEILKKCKDHEIHTAVDTAGYIPWKSFEKILEYTDLFLYDIKFMTPALHKEYTGVDNDLILKNLSRLLKSNIPLWIRIPVISGINDTDEEFKKIKLFLEVNGKPEKIELLPYHSMGEYKYSALNRSFETFLAPDRDKLKHLKSIVL